MKIIKFLLIIPIILVAVIYYSCDDSGVLPSDVPRGQISFTQKRLNHIDPNIDGVYELWLRIDSLGSVTNHSLGRFNIDGNGNVTDTGGGTIEFKYQGDTSALGFSTDAFITVEPPGDFNGQPSSAVLLSGHTEIKLDSLYTTMKLSGSLALGSAGAELLSGNHARYMLNTPTSSAVSCLRGLWFCDTAGNTGFPSGLLMTSSGWFYQGWVMDKSVPSNPIYYNMGRFTNPYGPDFNGAGPCAGTGTPYSKPGEDWVLDSCSSGRPQNLNNLIYEVFVTLEPAYETPSSTAYYRPFLKVYKQGVIEPSLTCKRIDNLFSQYTLLPEAKLRISY
jgi:hypothetical protein